MALSFANSKFGCKFIVFLKSSSFQRPTAGEAGQYRCNIKNDQGETNANLKLDFQQEEAPSEGSRRSKTPSRPGTPSSKKHREGTPGEKRERRHKSKSREGSPRKHIRSRTATPTQEVEGGLKPPGAESREPTREGNSGEGKSFGFAYFQPKRAEKRLKTRKDCHRHRKARRAAAAGARVRQCRQCKVLKGTNGLRL